MPSRQPAWTMIAATVSLVSVLALVSVLSTASSASAESAVPEPGLAVGQPAPGFTLLDQTGERRSLESLLGRGQLAIIFFRSADW